MSVLSLILKPLAYLGLPVFLLHTASRSSPVARYYVRLTLYLSTIGLCSAWGAVVSFAMALAGQRFNVNWVIARTFYAVASRVMDIKISVEGEEHLDTRPAVLVGNHQSMLDILYLGRSVPIFPPHKCPYPNISLILLLLPFCSRSFDPSAGYSPSEPPSWPRKSFNGCLFLVNTSPHQAPSSSTAETTPKPFAHSLQPANPCTHALLHFGSSPRALAQCARTMTCCHSRRAPSISQCRPVYRSYPLYVRTTGGCIGRMCLRAGR